MNERIEQLKHQASLWCDMNIPEQFSENGYGKAWEDKFAELIVRMCADYADMAQDAGCEYAGDYVAEAMGYGEKEGITAWRAK
jgi:hypothetical protein